MQLRKILPIVAAGLAAYFSGGLSLAGEGAAAGAAEAGAGEALAGGVGDAALAEGVGASSAGDAALGSAMAGGGVSDVTITDSAIGGSKALPWAVGGSAALGYVGQQQTNAMNAAQAQQSMAFQASQTGTAYQRAVADMRAAGLNPMLAYSQGGASSGSGATAVMGNSLAAATSSAMNAAMTVQQIDNMQSQNAATLAQIDNTRADTALKILNRPKVTADTRLSNATAANAENALAGVAADSALKQRTLESNVSSAASAAREASASADITQYGVPEARLGALGAGSKAVQEIAPFTGWLNHLFHSATSARHAIGR